MKLCNLFFKEYDFLCFFIMRLMLLIFCLAFVATVAQYQIPECHNYGVPILTRTNYKPYMVRFQCLCPFDYYGEHCDQHRSILCFTKQTHVLSYDIRPKNRTAKLSYDMTCLLLDVPIQQDPDTNSSQRKRTTKSYKKLPLLQSQAKAQYEYANYYLDPDYDIIWENDTTMFEEDGTFINSDNDTRLQKDIFDDYPHHEFVYDSKFLGVTLSNSSLVYSLQSFRFVNSSVTLGQIQPVLTPVFDSQNVTVSMKVLFSVETSVELQEYGVTRLELDFIEYYGPDQIMHKMLMDHPRWLLNNPNIPKGDYLTSHSSVSSSLWMVLITITIILLIVVGKCIIRKYKKWKKSKLMVELQQQSGYSTH